MFYQVKTFVEHGRLSRYCYQLSHSTALHCTANDWRPSYRNYAAYSSEWKPPSNCSLRWLQGMIDAEVWIHDTQQDQFQSEGVFIIWAQPDLNALISRCAALSTQQTRGKYISIETGRMHQLAAAVTVPSSLRRQLTQYLTIITLWKQPVVRSVPMPI